MSFMLFIHFEGWIFLQEASHCHCYCANTQHCSIPRAGLVVRTLLPVQLWLHETTFPRELHLLSWFAKWPSAQGAIWAPENRRCRGERWQRFLLRLGNWPPHESVERYLLCSHCSIRLCMNFFHLLACWAKSSLNAKVFIMAVESGLARGHPWCSTGCLGKTGIRKATTLTGRGNQLRWMTPISFISLATD